MLHCSLCSHLQSNSLLIIPLSLTSPSNDTGALVSRTWCLVIILKQLQQQIKLKRSFFTNQRGNMRIYHWAADGSVFNRKLKKWVFFLQ